MLNFGRPAVIVGDAFAHDPIVGKQNRERYDETPKCMRKTIMYALMLLFKASLHMPASLLLLALHLLWLLPSLGTRSNPKDRWQFRKDIEIPLPVELLHRLRCIFQTLGGVLDNLDIP